MTNSNSAELIGENEAALQARVSTSTLARFAEAGYFQVVLRGAERCYPKQALSSLFGVTFENSVEPLAATPKRDNVIVFPQSEISTPTNVEAALESENVISAPPLETQSSPGEEKSEEKTGAKEQNVEIDTSFRSILKMHTDILDRQEREIQDLRSEREWLKKRIEKLEEKAERDQILLLSEAQTVKQLIQIQAQKKSVIRQSLEWLGVIPQELPEHDALVTPKALHSESGQSNRSRDGKVE